MRGIVAFIDDYASTSISQADNRASTVPQQGVELQQLYGTCTPNRAQSGGHSRLGPGRERL